MDRRALELAHRAVSRRERTVAEVRATLEGKQVEPDTIEEVVEQLLDDGLLDDARYARLFTQDKRQLERWGSTRIAQDLRRRGIAPDLIDAALAGTGRDDELGTALTLLRERFAPPESDRERDKAWRLLVRRGYDPELAYEAVREFARPAAA